MIVVVICDMMVWICLIMLWILIIDIDGKCGSSVWMMVFFCFFGRLIVVVRLCGVLWIVLGENIIM